MKDITNLNDDKGCADPVQCIFDKQIPTKSCAAVVLWNMGMRFAIGFVAETLHEILASSHWDETVAPIKESKTDDADGCDTDCESCQHADPDGVGCSNPNHPLASAKDYVHRCVENELKRGVDPHPNAECLCHEQDECLEQDRDVCRDCLKKIDQDCREDLGLRDNLPCMKPLLAGCLNQHGNCSTCPDFSDGDCLGGIEYENRKVIHPDVRADLLRGVKPMTDRKVIHMDETENILGCKDINHLEGPDDCVACAHCNSCFPEVAETDTVDLAKAEMRVAATFQPLEPVESWKDLRKALTVVPVVEDNECITCKWGSLYGKEMPCRECTDHGNWEALDTWQAGKDLTEEYHVESAFAGISVRVDSAYNKWTETCQGLCKNRDKELYCTHPDNHVSDCIFKYCPRVWTD